VAAMSTPAVKERMDAIGAESSRLERRRRISRKFVMSEIEKWAGPIKASGISMD
jgi:hypothetical protein